MKRPTIAMVILLVLAVLTAGCNFPTPGEDSVSGDIAQTFAAQTIEARLTENATGGGQPTDDGTGPAATTQAPDQPPTNTPTATNTSTVTPTPTEETPCNQASFVKDVTVPDGTEYPPDTNFTKTWRLKNTGTCTWNNDYDLVFDDGDKMGGSNVESISLGSVEPGETVDISVELTSPSTPGDYRGNWLLRSDDGVVFGLGDSDNAFFVDIKVVDAVSFTVLDTNVYSCGMDTYVSVRIRNTGSEDLESSGGSAKNLDTDAVTNYLFWNTPFTENQNDCPTMNIDNLEPGDTYWTTYNMASASSVEYRYTLVLCTGEGGAGDCASKTFNVDIP